jgi:CRP/FNR family transcriptional regulator, cyclic AMP receptor protein
MSIAELHAYHFSNTECFEPSNLNKLKQIMYEYNASPGTFLYWEGDMTDKLYYLVRGRVKITKATDDGKQLILYMHQTGDLFGELEAMHVSKHSFNAEVSEDSVIGIIQLKDLEILLWQHGDLAIDFMKWMEQMHRITQTKFRDLMLFGKPGALCSVLIRLTNSYGKPHGKYRIIPMRLTNTELAEMIGATRESVNRMLSDLKKQNVLDYEDNLIIIKNFEYLREVCHCEDCPGNICRI